LALAGHAPRPDVAPGGGDGAGPVIVAEDRRYLYFKDRFRLNLHGRYKNMSAEERQRNEALSDRLAEPPSIRAFVRYPQKMTVTSLCLADDGSSPTETRRQLTDLGAQLPGAPTVALHGHRLYAFQRHDVVADPLEDRNLIGPDASWPDAVLDGGWASSVSMPAGDGEVDLSTLVDTCEPVGVVGS
jgi:hypothetical protein